MTNANSAKTWFITGANRGIGLAVAKAALAAGDRVVATGRNVAQLAETFKADADRVLSVVLDVTDEAQAERAVEAAVKRFGRIDVLVNNAGYGQLGAFEENGVGDIEQQFDTNFYGTFHVTRAVLPVMRKQRSGHIFNLSSVGGVVSVAGASLYCATKFAVEGFSEGLAQEVAQFGIHVTLVEPGPFRTDFLDTSSVRFGTKQVADYADWSKKSQASWNARNHLQGGDTDKLGEAVVTLAATKSPPLRYAAGTNAVQRIEGKLKAMQAELDTWRALSVGTDGTFEDAVKWAS
jgi:NAD(P)-dependent dehydrogenase (short-subunit alcohol dehydrogenase family)